MSKFGFHKQAIYIVTPSESFRPVSPWNWPEDFTAGLLYQKNVSTAEARLFCRTFNYRQIALGFPIREWAIAARFLRRRGNGPQTRPDGQVARAVAREYLGHSNPATTARYVQGNRSRQAAD